ncbi:MAG: phage major capsid domain-containing protein [Candidatus Fonsibacter sp.]
MLWQSTVTLRISSPNKAATYFAIYYRVTDARAPFPLHILIRVMSCTINNKTINLNVHVITLAKLCSGNGARASVTP